MNLKSLIHRELCEGMTEEQVASSVGISLRAIKDILTGKDPQIRAIWKKFARCFRMDVEFLRTGEAIPELGWKPGDFVIATRHDTSIASTLLRQIKLIGTQYILHPVNWKYEDLPLTEPDFVWGKVVRLRKNL